MGFVFRKTLVASATLLCAALLPLTAKASVFSFSFSGPGVSGSISLTYGSATDSKYPQAFEVTGISGTFSDSNNGLNIVNAAIGPLVPINYATPESTNLLAPHDFSKYAATGLPADNNGFLSFDNLFWPGGSPQTASDYPAAGGFLDIYGLMFNIGNGQVVDFWSNGAFGNSPAFDYGVAVAGPGQVGNTSAALDYVSGGVTVSPEPSAFALLGSGLLGMWAWRRRASRQNGR